jgi:hypothetical protein
MMVLSLEDWYLGLELMGLAFTQPYTNVPRIEILGINNIV